MFKRLLLLYSTSLYQLKVRLHPPCTNRSNTCVHLSRHLIRQAHFYPLHITSFFAWSISHFLHLSFLFFFFSSVRKETKKEREGGLLPFSDWGTILRIIKRKKELFLFLPFLLIFFRFSSLFHAVRLYIDYI